MSSEPMLGIYRASVANNADPLKEVRVTLLIPQILGTAESAWAIPSAPTNTVPVVGQVVWVQFSGGDITKPVYTPLGLKEAQDQIDSGIGDTLPPKEPTALTLTTVQYSGSEGVTQARVTATWTVPTENQDGSLLTDLSHYVFQSSYDALEWSGGVLTPDSLLITDGLRPGVSFFVRVQAVDRYGNGSLWATKSITTASSTTPPPVPSRPSVSGVLGGLRVVWDGRDSTGAVMPAILSHVQVQRDTVETFTNPVVVGSLPGADSLYDSVQNYGTAYYYRLVSYSKVGMASAPSQSSSDLPKQAGVGDLAVNSVMSNFLVTGRIIAEDGIIESIDAGTIKAGTLTGTTVRTSATGRRVVLDPEGKIRLFSGASNETKEASLIADVVTDDGGEMRRGSLVLTGPTHGSHPAPELVMDVDPSGIRKWRVGPLLAYEAPESDGVTILGNLISSGSADVFGKLTAGNIRSGQISITPVADTPTSVTVSGLGLTGVPRVVVTPNSQDPYTRVRGWSVSNPTANGFTIWLTRTTTTATTMYWFAIGG